MLGFERLMGEQELIHLEKRLLVVDEKVKQAHAILLGELLEFDPALGQVGQLRQCLFKLHLLLGIIVRYSGSRAN